MACRALIRGVYGPQMGRRSRTAIHLVFAWPCWLMENLSGAVLAAKNWLGREVFVQTSTLAITSLAILIGLSMH